MLTLKNTIETTAGAVKTAPTHLRKADKYL